MGTSVGLLHLSFHVPGARSLKDKRRAMRSFKDRLAHSHNVSIAEVDGHDNHRRVVLAVAMVGSDRRYLESALQGIVNAAESQRRMILTDQDVEWF